LILGGLIGSRIRRKIDLEKLSIEQLICFKVDSIIAWTKKNQKRIDHLWYAILLERVRDRTVTVRSSSIQRSCLSIRTKRLSRRPSPSKSLPLILSYSVRALLTSKGSIAMLEPLIPTIADYLESNDLEKKRTIYKTFMFYIPFLQLFRLSKNYKQYS